MAQEEGMTGKRSQEAIFTPKEHELFVEAVEMYCKENSDERVWDQVASHMKSRNAEQVKAHAMYYMMSLQSRNPEKLSWPMEWTKEENEIFEAALANFDEGDSSRWQKIAELLPTKTPLDVQQWYQRLLADILEIERGAHPARSTPPSTAS